MERLPEKETLNIRDRFEIPAKSFAQLKADGSVIFTVSEANFGGSAVDALRGFDQGDLLAVRSQEGEDPLIVEVVAYGKATLPPGDYSVDKYDVKVKLSETRA